MRHQIQVDFIEDGMTKLLKEGKVINKKTSEGLNSFYSNIKNQEHHHPSLNKVESQNKDQTRIAIRNQIDVNITKHVLETLIAKKKSKPPDISVPIINENIETPILKNTKSNPPILENFELPEIRSSTTWHKKLHKM